METIRKPIVSGSFYPSDKKEIMQSLDNYFREVDSEDLSEKKIFAIISPHAGYFYSGKTAAFSFAPLRKAEFKRVVLIGPSHQSHEFYFSIGNYDYYQTPLGKVEVDKEFTNLLLEDSKFVFYPFAHSVEHSLEVQLPFLQYVNNKAMIVPILIGQQYDKSSEYLSKKLYDVFKDVIDETIFVISTDLSHYHDSNVAEEMDSKTIDMIQKIKTDELQENIRNGRIEACGFGGILTLLNLCKLTGIKKNKVLDYTHSGFMNQDFQKVVGYLSMLFYQD